MNKEEMETLKAKEEMICIYDAGREVSYDIKLSAAKEYIATAKALEARLIKEGKL